MFGWMTLGTRWTTEQVWRALEILKENHIPARMPSDDMFFVGPFHLPHPDRRWQICVRRRDALRARALLEKEGLISGATPQDRAEEDDPDPTPASPAADARRIPRGTARSGCRGLKPPARRAPV